MVCSRCSLPSAKHNAAHNYERALPHTMMRTMPVNFLFCRAGNGIIWTHAPTSHLTFLPQLPTYPQKTFSTIQTLNSAVSQFLRCIILTLNFQYLLSLSESLSLFACHFMSRAKKTIQIYLQIGKTYKLGRTVIVTR